MAHRKKAESCLMPNRRVRTFRLFIKNVQFGSDTKGPSVVTSMHTRTGTSAIHCDASTFSMWRIQSEQVSKLAASLPPSAPHLFLP
jgi:hypothetical protein